MDTQVVVTAYDHETGVTWDISNTVSDISISTQMYKSPGKATFTVIQNQDAEFRIYVGVIIDIYVNSYRMFHGRVFTKSSDEKLCEIKVSCYDNLRYLMNHIYETVPTENLGETFKRLSNSAEKNIITGEVPVSPVGNIDAHFYQDKSTLEVLEDRIDRQRAYNNEVFFMHAEGDTIQLLRTVDCGRDYGVDDENAILSYNYETSIDSNTYNRIVLYTEKTISPGTKGLDKIQMSQDEGKENSISSRQVWGTLELMHKLPDNTISDADMIERAEKMLELYNHPTRTITFSMLGYPNMFAGCALWVNKLTLDDRPKDNPYQGYLLVTSCTHTLSGNIHTMELKANMVIKAEGFPGK